MINEKNILGTGGAEELEVLRRIDTELKPMAKKGIPLIFMSVADNTLTGTVGGPDTGLEVMLEQAFTHDKQLAEITARALVQATQKEPWTGAMASMTAGIMAMCAKDGKFRASFKEMYDRLVEWNDSVPSQN